MVGFPRCPVPAARMKGPPWGRQGALERHQIMLMCVTDARENCMPGVYKDNWKDQVLSKYSVFATHLRCHLLTSRAPRAWEEFIINT